MEVIISSAVLSVLISSLALYTIHRVNRNHSSLENEINRAHAFTLASINHNFSKEAHAANYLYTRKAIFLEQAYDHVGELSFWAEKCVVSTTNYDFGTPQEIAVKMMKCFEDYRLLSIKKAPFIKDKSEIWKIQYELSSTVNYIANQANSNDFSAESQEWKDAATAFRDRLPPLSELLKKEVRLLMEHQC
jgi:hypothetical protein